MRGVGVLLAASGLGALVTAALAPAVIRLARRLAILDRPGGYKAHGSPTPTLGGMAVAGGGIGAALGVGGTDLAGAPGLWAIGLGFLIMLVAGAFDDLRGLSPPAKLGWQGAAAVLGGLGLVQMSAAASGAPLSVWSPRLVTMLALSALWVVAVTNAVNFLDNTDGLCAGLAVVTTTALAVHLLRSGHPHLALVPAALGGACAGFLPYNWPRARIFLGDTGSLSVGFALGCLSLAGAHLAGAQGEGSILALAAPVAVLAVPVLDLVLVVALRLRAGHRVWIGDRRHLNHRLVRRGLGPAPAVMTLWAVSAACGAAALLLPTAGTPLVIAFLVCALGTLTVAAGARGLP
jgi:UDP-GlcNAc:undecaprenyl-phosphate/decaprenyl-phosphate GlcNAc-1-phosphate transferase